jgi:hypothetical protein
MQFNKEFAESGRPEHERLYWSPATFEQSRRICIRLVQKLDKFNKPRRSLERSNFSHYIQKLILET